MKQCYYFLAFLFTALVSHVGSYGQCADPVPSVINISNDSVTVTWPAVTAAAGYEYVIQLASMPQPSSGTPTANTMIGVGSLPYAAHTAWVRTDCGSGTFSNWASISFTIVCSKPGSVNVTNVTDTSAAISWSQVTGINSYEYVLDNNSADPTVAGTPTTATSYNATGLQPGNDYYMHVRSQCGAGGTMSAWTTEHFVTQYPVNVITVESKNIIRAYPNPVADVLHLQLPQGAQAGNIVVTDISGRVVKQIPATGKEMHIDMQALSKGLYLLKYTGKTGNDIIRVVKQ